MIDYLIKDLTTVEVDEGIILHGCNCVGGFGSGVAGAIRKKWPHVYESFRENGVGEDLLGTAQMIINIADDYPIVVNAYTQLTCGYDGKRYADPKAIEKTLMTTAEYAEISKLDVFMPKIGCGLGGLSWEDEVLPIVMKVSSQFPDVNIHICDI